MSRTPGEVESAARNHLNAIYRWFMTEANPKHAGEAGKNLRIRFGCLAAIG